MWRTWMLAVGLLSNLLVGGDRHATKSSSAQALDCFRSLEEFTWSCCGAKPTFAFGSELWIGCCEHLAQQCVIHRIDAVRGASEVPSSVSHAVFREDSDVVLDMDDGNKIGAADIDGVSVCDQLNDVACGGSAFGDVTVEHVVGKSDEKWHDHSHGEGVARLPRILFDVTPHAVRQFNDLQLHTLSRRRLAVVSILVQTDDHESKGKADLLLNALQLRCSAVRKGSLLPFYMISAHLDARGADLLRSFGWVVENRTSDVEFMKMAYWPIYDEHDAAKQNRLWVQGVTGQHIEKRIDGWATYFKFYAWNSTAYDQALLVDVDVCFKENPDIVFLKMPAETAFAASPEKRFGKYWGLNSHMMVLRPSNKEFRALVDRARRGHYIPYTNSEQDVLEAAYPGHLFAPESMHRIVKHHHYRNVVQTTRCSATALAELSSPTCDDFWERCMSPNLASGC
eukprot:TRINITY_DN67738_c0_g1_i1.p1 TRINITY_DN67738_c0_g1~~TRINITY_DN67738_c0_g1_i1.p1  ORF type:complete len:453 (+),score=58.75 TRINITY_DN67738_c0_g1_i1:65-1423(+)